MADLPTRLLLLTLVIGSAALCTVCVAASVALLRARAWQDRLFAAFPLAIVAMLTWATWEVLRHG